MNKTEIVRKTRDANAVSSTQDIKKKTRFKVSVNLNGDRRNFMRVGSDLKWRGTCKDDLWFICLNIWTSVYFASQNIS